MINISKLKGSKIFVEHTGYEDSELAWGDSTSIFMLTKSTTTETFYIDYEFQHHLPDYNITKAFFNLEEDGLYNIVHFTVPKKYALEGKSFETLVYWDDALYINGERAEAEDLLFIDEDMGNSSMIIETECFFSIYYLQECLKSIIDSIICGIDDTKANTYFKDKTGKIGPCGICETPRTSDLFKKRDLIMMFLHQIRFALEKGFCADAQKYLEKLNKCGNICDTYPEVKKNKSYIRKSKPSKGNGCECKRY